MVLNLKLKVQGLGLVCIKYRMTDKAVYNPVVIVCLAAT